MAGDLPQDGDLSVSREVLVEAPGSLPGPAVGGGKRSDEDFRRF